MHPFFNSTRASIISWPTTNCRCSSGVRSSSGTLLHGMYWSTDGLAARGETVFFKPVLDFFRERELDWLLDVCVGFFFDIGTLLHGMYWSTDGLAARGETVFFKPVLDFFRERELDWLLDVCVGFFFELLFLIN